MNDILKAVLGRLVGAGVGAALGYATSKGVPALSPDASAQLTNAIVSGATLVGYAVAHKLVNRKVNPNDTAKA